MMDSLQDELKGRKGRIPGSSSDEEGEEPLLLPYEMATPGLEQGVGAGSSGEAVAVADDASKGREAGERATKGMDGRAAAAGGIPDREQDQHGLPELPELEEADYEYIQEALLTSPHSK